MIRADYHIHTEDSYDSRLKAVDLVTIAKKLSYDIIAITEHLDLLPQELGYFGAPSLFRYLKRLDNLIAANPDLLILKGIEIGDYQCHSDFAYRLVEQFDFDIILGSVHFLKDHTNLAIPIKRKMDKAALTEYYLSNLELVENCKIDVLAHLGVYKRFYSAFPDEKHCVPIIRDIFRTIIDREIALELNYACFRKVYQSVIPEPFYIDLYLQMGGRLFTLASDAHQEDHLHDHYDDLPVDLLKRLKISDRKSRVLEYI
jgi:histidinol-phosphatase (PHP family)